MFCKRNVLVFILALSTIGVFAQDKPVAAQKGNSKSAVKEKGLYALIDTNLGQITLRLNPRIAPKTVENFVGLAKGEKEFVDIKTGSKVKKPFYNGLVFHRVMPNFMIQGGCPRGNGSGGPGYTFEDECYGVGEEVKGTIEDEATAHLVFKDLLAPYLQAKPNDKEISELVKACAVARSGKPLMGKDVEYFKLKTGSKKKLFKKGKLKGEVKYGALCMANRGPNTNGSQFFIVTKKDGCTWLNGKHTVFGEVVKGMDVVHKIENVQRDGRNKPFRNVTINSITIEKVD